MNSELVSFVICKDCACMLVKCPNAPSSDHPDHLSLFRDYVSRKATGKGRAVLEGVGLDVATVEMCFRNNVLNEEEAVQTGSIKWSDGQGLQPPN